MLAKSSIDFVHRFFVHRIYRLGPKSTISSRILSPKKDEWIMKTTHPRKGDMNIANPEKPNLFPQFEVHCCNKKRFWFPWPMSRPIVEALASKPAINSADASGCFFPEFSQWLFKWIVHNRPPQKKKNCFFLNMYHAIICYSNFIISILFIAIDHNFL